MAAENPESSPERKLNSWKEIAAFVGRDERTVKRWEHTRGLPVRRLPGPGHVYVFAYVDEIKAWLNGRDRITHVRPPAIEGKRRVAPRATAGLGIFGSFAAVAVTVIVVIIFGDRLIGSSPTATMPFNSDIPPSSAIQLYREGVHEWQARSPYSLASAIVDFERAIRIDPRYAAAYVGLANAYNIEGEFTAIPAAQLYPKSAAAAKRAISLDPSLAGAHAALAFSEFYGLRDVRSSQREFEKALALDPASATVRHWYATILMTIGSSRRALMEIDKAAELDSESSAIPADKALMLFHAGQRELAIKLLTQLEKDQPEFAAPHRYLATIWLAAGDDVDYLRELKLSALARHDSDDQVLAIAGSAGLSRAGHLGMLRTILATQQALFAKGRQSAFRLAATFALMHDTNDALAYIALSVKRHEPDNIALKVDPPFDALRKDPRFVGLVNQAGLGNPSRV